MLGNANLNMNSSKWCHEAKFSWCHTCIPPCRNDPFHFSPTLDTFFVQVQILDPEEVVEAWVRRRFSRWQQLCQLVIDKLGYSSCWFSFTLAWNGQEAGILVSFDHGLVATLPKSNKEKRRRKMVMPCPSGQVIVTDLAINHPNSQLDEGTFPS